MYRTPNKVEVIGISASCAWLFLFFTFGFFGETELFGIYLAGWNGAIKLFGLWGIVAFTLGLFHKGKLKNLLASQWVFVAAACGLLAISAENSIFWIKFLCAYSLFTIVASILGKASSSTFHPTSKN